MAETIVAIEVIARQAAAAAKWALEHPRGPAPQNPYCPNMQPEHHKEWERRLDIAMARAAEVDGEASA